MTDELTATLDPRKPGGKIHLRRGLSSSSLCGAEIWDDAVVKPAEAVTCARCISLRDTGTLQGKQPAPQHRFAREWRKR